MNSFACILCMVISIHSARVGGDGHKAQGRTYLCDFNPLRPCGRRQDLKIFTQNIEPISIHSARVGGDAISCFMPYSFHISIHSARVGGDPFSAGTHCGAFISIHSARVGGDHVCYLTSILFMYFNPLRPCGRRPSRFRTQHKAQKIFQSTPPVWAETAKETIFSSLKHLYYNIFYRKKQENSM